ncbi:hypothetical protein [Clostridium sp.]|uniref:hypothetical protein n=1 Tax=Clostridium sp. TaxID=1506 RepID=UPI00284AAE0D|nr:hypothetical protein [Clostridium sp.]MDR3598753.1 hypothetical protein [Clostridium sp.]
MSRSINSEDNLSEILVEKLGNRLFDDIKSMLMLYCTAKLQLVICRRLIGGLCGLKDF